ncbi:hypothetical protein NSK_006207 [Nannochloropsis salina CCMP1776]|uniref:UBA domain-containing protein n=1 Tax=Nannochloropsis salina CCMP1776 TaxID=1027361 RepID=A0A4D9CTC5_9STRA|nr:hypothetical protein NSK_006207 [Nannochloropsis salina CCMP1776]|eukprot:TFJ82481.1 hypothetical protein NSK_006207 [Nannochloropsis salina CCMP1776]
MQRPFSWYEKLTFLGGGYGLSQGLAVVLARGLGAAAVRCNRSSTGGEDKAAKLETLSELCNGLARNLLEKGLSEEPVSKCEKEKQGIYLWDCLDLVGGMLLDDRRERAVQLNVPLTLCFLREETTDVFTLILQGTGNLLQQIVEDASEDAQHESRPPSQRHARLLPLLPPLLLLLHRFSSRHLILNSPYRRPSLPPSLPLSLPPAFPHPLPTRRTAMSSPSACTCLWPSICWGCGRPLLPVGEGIWMLFREIARSLEEDQEAILLAPPGGSGGGREGGRGGGRGGGRAALDGGASGTVSGNGSGQLLEALSRLVHDAGGGEGEGGRGGAGRGGVPPPAPFVPNEAEVSQLMEMGFTRPHVVAALRYARGRRLPLEQAMEYLLTHPPLPRATKASS